MRSFLSGLLVFTLVVLIAVCFGLIFVKPPYVKSKFDSAAETWGKEPELWIDPETNCQYFRVMGGMTPRLGTDGFPLCNFELQVGSE